MQVQSQVGNIPWRRAWQPTPVLLPGESVDRGAWQAVVHRVAKSGHSCSGFARARASPEAASAFPPCFCSAVTVSTAGVSTPSVLLGGFLSSQDPGCLLSVL